MKILQTITIHIIMNDTNWDNMSPPQLAAIVATLNQITLQSVAANAMRAVTTHNGLIDPGLEAACSMQNGPDSVKT